MNAQVRELERPLLACEAVVTEALYLLARHPQAQDGLWALLGAGAITVEFRIGEHIAALRALMRKYRDTPMSLADASIVRMAELHKRHAVLTLDSDFSLYRKHGRAPLALLHPGASA